MKRRSFLSRIALLSGGLMTGGIAVLGESFRKVKTLRGVVTDGSKGIANVVVSDGYSVVATNKKGEYHLELNPDARFVFVSTPSGYEFPEEKKIARHYAKADKLSTKKTLNFELKKLAGNDDEHDFIIWADTQPKTKSDMRRLEREMMPDVKDLLATMPAGTIIHGITVGDIVWDSPELYGDYCDVVKEVGIPFFQCIGNHDMDLNKGGDETSDRTFNEWFGPTHYSFNRGKVHYVVLDDVRYLGQGKKYDGYITENQLEWLKKDLQYVPKDHLLILCAHIPVLRGVSNKDALLAITKEYNMHIMSGHTHLNYNTIQGEIFEHNHGTVCGALWTGDICGDGTPNGYAVYKVKGTELSWYYKSVGKPADYQFELYPQVSEDGKKSIVVNVWNHDPEWKVEYWTDGKYKGVVPKSHGFDPKSVSLYEGPDLPKGRGSVDPKKTDHLFKATLQAETAEVKVVVTDRFGKKYSSTKKIG